MRFLFSPSVTFSSVKNLAATACLGTGLLFSALTSATTVQFQTVLGNFEVNLYDKTTPKTVANFLAYVEAEAYNNTVIHRTKKDFVVQGGGYSFVTTDKLDAITTRAAVENEPVYSNVRGTIAMAKLGNNPNSATSQWFINLSDNSTTLDKQNGGFTAFGEVVGGMDVVLAIADLQRFNFNGAFNELPLRNYSADDYTDKKPVTDEHFVLVERVVVLNADPDTAANLNPPKNTLITQKEDKSSSGSLGLLSLLALALLALGRKTLLNKA